MNVFKRLTIAAATSALALMAVPASADTRIALVVKSLGNGFFDAAAKGADEAAAEIGGIEIIYTGPTAATAEGQIEIVNALIAQRVDAIAISANDPDALVPVLKKAMDRGITVISWDSGVAAEGRQMHLNPSDTALIGETIIKLAADYLPYGGDVAILSASSTAANQNAWIDAAKAAMPTMFPNINLVATVYGDDDSANFGSFFESTLMQEMEWHLHTAVFCLVLGYGYTHNRHVRVDFLREDFTFKSKAKVEFFGNIFFMLPFTLVCIYFAIIYMIDSYQINEVSASLVGLSQRWIIKTYLPIGFMTLFLAGLAVMIQLIAVIWGDNKKKLNLIALEYDENK